jgi:hypothetical protein
VHTSVRRSGFKDLPLLRDMDKFHPQVLGILFGFQSKVFLSEIDVLFQLF